jgi:hypothetical protein
MHYTTNTRGTRAKDSGGKGRKQEGTAKGFTKKRGKKKDREQGGTANATQPSRTYKLEE